MNEPDSPEMREAQRLGNQLCFAVYSTAHAFNRLYRPLLEPLGLTYPQYLVLLVLWETDGLAVREIGDALHLDSGTLTPLLKRMEAAGLLTRARAKDDERRLVVRLTDQGRGLRDRAAGLPVAIGCAIGGGTEEITRLRRTLDELRDAMNRAADAAERSRSEQG